MPKHLDPTEENFKLLMSWLGPNDEAAGDKYEHIRQSLVKFFVGRGCWDAEDLADEAIDRVTRKISEVTINYSGDPALYFFGVAKLMMLERHRQDTLRTDPQVIELRLPAATEEGQEEAEQRDRKLECLEQCVAELSEENRKLVMDYYQGVKRAKIDFRRRIAERLGIDLKALRVRMFRIRASLFKCMEKCLGRDTECNELSPKS
jgi:RNA polymerase sigma factor (sigma-70 family)